MSAELSSWLIGAVPSPDRRGTRPEAVVRGDSCGVPAAPPVLRPLLPLPALLPARAGGPRFPPPSAIRSAPDQTGTACRGTSAFPARSVAARPWLRCYGPLRPAAPAHRIRPGAALSALGHRTPGRAEGQLGGTRLRRGEPGETPWCGARPSREKAGGAVQGYAVPSRAEPSRRSPAAPSRAVSHRSAPGRPSPLSRGRSQGARTGRGFSLPRPQRGGRSNGRAASRPAPRRPSRRAIVMQIKAG